MKRRERERRPEKITLSIVTANWLSLRDKRFWLPASESELSFIPSQQAIFFPASLAALFKIFFIFMNHFPVVGRPKWPVVTLVYVCSRPLCPSQPPRPFCWPTNIRCFSWFFLFQKKSYYIKLKRFTGPGVRWCNSFECQDDFSVSACCFTSNDVGGKGAESRSDGQFIWGGGLLPACCCGCFAGCLPCRWCSPQKFLDFINLWAILVATGVGAARPFDLKSIF